MKEKDLRNLLLEQPLPDEHIAEERSWDAVRAAFLAREPVPRERHVPWRLLIAAAIVAAGIAIGVSPAGSEVADWVRDKLGRDRVASVAPAEPVVAPPLPAPGRLLVAAPNGVWVVNEDGGKRRLGAYDGATWSPNGLFVGAWTERELVALDPAVTDGLHWTVSQRGISEARWAPSGFRVAYLARSALRVVIGNGDNDRELAAPVARVAPAWRPGAQHVVAYSDRLGRVIAVDVDSGENLFRTARAPVPVALGWTAESQQLVVLTEQQLRMFRAPRTLVRAIEIPRRLLFGDGARRPAEQQRRRLLRLLGANRPGHDLPLQRPLLEAALLGRRALRGHRLVARRAAASGAVGGGRPVAVRAGPGTGQGGDTDRRGAAVRSWSDDRRRVPRVEGWVDDGEGAEGREAGAGGDRRRVRAAAGDREPDARSEERRT